MVVGNGEKLLITHVGHSTFPIVHLHSTKHLILKHILYIPIITKNLINISKLLEDSNVNIVFDESVCMIKDKPQGRTLL